MYSNAVKIGGLNDYLNPSEECILPVNKNPGTYEVKLSKDASRKGNMGKEGTSGKRDTRVTVGLSDCLSCSGCLTSSEEILMKNDHFVTVIEKLKNASLAAVSISPQTVYAIAVCYRIDPVTAFGKLSHLFRMLGAKNVYSMNIGEAIAINESKVEFVESFLSSCSTALQEDYRNGKHLPHDYNGDAHQTIISSHCPGWTLYAEKMLNRRYIERISAISSSQLIQGLVIKAFAHARQFCQHLGNVAKCSLNGCIYGGLHPCRGLDVYRHMRLSVLPTESLLESGWSYTPVYHVSIAPCYDKRLEALRPQYEHDFGRLLRSQDVKDGERVKLVDDVLSTNDIQAILKRMDLDFLSLPEAPVDEISKEHLRAILKIFGQGRALKIFSKSQTFPGMAYNSPEENINLSILMPRMNGQYGRMDDEVHRMNLYRPSKIYCQSGGFAEEIFKFAAKELFGINVQDAEFKETINSDFKVCLMNVCEWRTGAWRLEWVSMKGTCEL